MDRAMENLLIRTAGSFSLAAVLVHAGLDVPMRPLQALYLVPFFLLSLAANWALARLNVKRAALIAATVLLGVVPALMPLFHLQDMGRSGVYDGTLYASAAFGLATLAIGAKMLLARDKA